MELKELMIGDWFEFPSGNEKIQEISYHQELGGYCVWFAASATFFPCKVEEIKPIPLTAEILEKNGFNKSVSPSGIHAKCHEYDNPKEKYNLTIADYNKYKRLLLNIDGEDSECFNIKCDYVHQFQHALRLCGIDKEIKVV